MINTKTGSRIATTVAALVMMVTAVGATIAPAFAGDDRYDYRQRIEQRERLRRIQQIRERNERIRRENERRRWQTSNRRRWDNNKPNPWDRRRDPKDHWDNRRHDRPGRPWN